MRLYILLLVDVSAFFRSKASRALTKAYLSSFFLDPLDGFNMFTLRPDLVDKAAVNNNFSQISWLIISSLGGILLS